MDNLTIAVLAVVPLLLLCQSTWLFKDARKRARYPWFWGIWGLIQFPLPLIAYWLIVRSGWFSRRSRSH
ncbi:hypothetical protein COLU111180_14120 [Cohnella lubricantis]|uniref:Uncharacterized protein n=1 Tax=Cohnella lubricantis TaxID=2163172 RepID=A0A841TDH8_9BACL|nr:hypothetical protein [Cohnella lubricantis]MBB6679503.1 hypothetical protein [Cohnella lubricantis]MBP2118095.1 hypothetical protein [Cohnella lubricantis]